MSLLTEEKLNLSKDDLLDFLINTTFLRNKKCRNIKDLKVRENEFVNKLSIPYFVKTPSNGQIKILFAFGLKRLLIYHNLYSYPNITEYGNFYTIYIATGPKPLSFYVPLNEIKKYSDSEPIIIQNLKFYEMNIDSKDQFLKKIVSNLYYSLDFF